MSVDEKLKSLDRVKTGLVEVVDRLFEAGAYYDSIFPEERQNHFYKLRWEVGQKIEQVKLAAAKLRLDAEKSQSEG